MKNQGFKKSTFLLGFIAMFTGSAWAGNNPANMPVTPTIASLRAIPVAAATLYPNIQVQDYYGTGSGCPIQYKWNAADSTADDSGAIINPTGNVGAGRWNLNLPPASPLHSCVYGVKIDVPFPNSGGGTDQKTQLGASGFKARLLHPDQFYYLSTGRRDSLGEWFRTGWGRKVWVLSDLHTAYWIYYSNPFCAERDWNYSV
jgi:hypothetical protein